MRDHRLIDERSQAFASAIAEKLRRDPALVQLAKDNIGRWRTTCSPRLISTLEEWLEILSGPVEGVIQTLISTDEHAIRLRQSNPFPGALSERERNAILLEFEARDKEVNDKATA